MAVLTRRGPARGIVSFWNNKGDILPKNYTISGQTLNGSGAPLAGCAVHLFATNLMWGAPPGVEPSDIEVAEGVSDVNGNYSFFVDSPDSAPSTYYVVAYLPGSPDVAGTTINTLVGT